jgi:hypothetical protein
MTAIYFLLFSMFFWQVSHVETNHTAQLIELVISIMALLMSLVSVFARGSR